MLERVWRKENTPTLLVGMYIGAATMENSMELPYDPAMPLLGTYPEKTIIQKDIMHPSVQCSTIYNSQDVEAT